MCAVQNIKIKIIMKSLFFSSVICVHFMYSKSFFRVFFNNYISSPPLHRWNFKKYLYIYPFVLSIIDNKDFEKLRNENSVFFEKQKNSKKLFSVFAFYNVGSRSSISHLFVFFFFFLRAVRFGILQLKF